ncbi:unnamed protein product [Moneuplotes crassus]|uniref:Uncharacterized protein n=1 Tax=Euplotes crassus TaxID=5936 RepID=A0AAD1Y775_EUPCR|nr:unnamed protein product [Moneuplotes crassus]
MNFLKSISKFLPSKEEVETKQPTPAHSSRARNSNKQSIKNKEEETPGENLSRPSVKIDLSGPGGMGIESDLDDGLEEESFEDESFEDESFEDSFEEDDNASINQSEAEKGTTKTGNNSKNEIFSYNRQLAYLKIDKFARKKLYQKEHKKSSSALDDLSSPVKSKLQMNQDNISVQDKSSSDKKDHSPKDRYLIKADVSEEPTPKIYDRMAYRSQRRYPHESFPSMFSQQRKKFRKPKEERALQSTEEDKEEDYGEGFNKQLWQDLERVRHHLEYFGICSFILSVFDTNFTEIFISLISFE